MRSSNGGRAGADDVLENASRYDSPLTFHGLPTPSRAETAEIAGRVADRVEAILKKHGRNLDPAEVRESICTAGNGRTGTTGNSWSVWRANIARPPIAQKRLTQRPDGTLLLEFKKA